MKTLTLLFFVLIASFSLAACTGPAASTEENGTGASTPTESVRTYTLTEVAANDSRESCWTSIDGKVYDVTSAIDSHPGGESILQGCGQDSTELFEGVRQHGSPANQASLDELQIGVLAETSE